MMHPRSINSAENVASVLRSRGITPTAPRVLIGLTLFSRMTHVSAEDVYKIVNREQQRVSKATVYNTLGLFADKGLVREVIADPSKIFYDPNTSPHHHFYNVGTGELADIDSDELRVVGLPPLPEGVSLDGVDVIVRLKSARD
jgi:Fur family transcriptional regulator, iron response regulator